MKKRLIVFGAIAGLILFFLPNCSGEVESDEDPVTITQDVQLVSPNNQDQFVVGETMTVEVQVNHPDLISDLILYIDDTIYTDNLLLESQTIEVNTALSRVGYINVYLEYKDGTGKNHRDNRSVTFFSDIIPKYRNGAVVKAYPHNPGSYTQGLEFYKGSLYEGTGQYGTSLLAEVDLNSGAHIRTSALDDAYFGEGITLLNDTIYQISYKAAKCFVYDMNFTKINEFSYSDEGWGLCNNGQQILMSNGSSEIVWRDPETFLITKKLQVFDDQSNVGQLNELELINGSLYANIYTDNRIVEIDTTTGKVLSYIDFSSLVNEQPVTADYFNGISSDNGKIYVTGKLWPNLYEVKFE